MKGFPIKPRQVRYIKLGGSGDWENECLQNNIIRFGFGTADPVRFRICIAGRWDELKKTLISDGEKSKSVATNIANQSREFFEDDGSTLWITFIKEKLYWAFLDRSPPARHEDGKGVFRKIAGRWSDKDSVGAVILRDRLPGSISKLAGFRGTSCNVDVAKLVVNKINGVEPIDTKRTIDALKVLKDSTLTLVRGLGDKDFEVLIDLIFSRSGWRRTTLVGGTQKTKDFRVVLPTTQEQALVQVKSSTNSAELGKYTNALEEGQRLFWVFHTGSVKSDSDQVELIGPEELKTLIIEYGLVNWLIDKTELAATRDSNE